MGALKFGIIGAIAALIAGATNDLGYTGMSCAFAIIALVLMACTMLAYLNQPTE